MASHEQGCTTSTLETNFGERFVFCETAADIDGELLRMDTYLDPGVRRPLHSIPTSTGGSSSTLERSGLPSRTKNSCSRPARRRRSRLGRLTRSGTPATAKST